jgi:deazaflavin-dependent oxidoreductase (nitroreductase family)
MSLAAWLILNVLTVIDAHLLRWTDGRVSISSLSGLPIALVTTTGAKSGQPRTTPLLCMPDGDCRFLVASNAGQDHHPGWYYNLKANPLVEITLPGASGTYRARDARPAEREHLWSIAYQHYPGYAGYRRQVEARQIPIVVLEPQAD